MLLIINRAHYESARELWMEVLAQLDAMSSGEMQHIAAISNAVAFAIGMLEARLGLASAARWATRMESDPFQRIAALNLRRIVYLEQGDAEAADRMRRQAEVLSLRMQSPQMFRSMLAVELSACAKAVNLTGLQQGIEAVRPLAAAYPGWRPYLIAAEGNFDLVRGDFDAAKLKFEHCVRAHPNSTTTAFRTVLRCGSPRSGVCQRRCSGWDARERPSTKPRLRCTFAASEESPAKRSSSSACSPSRKLSLVMCKQPNASRR